MSLNARIFREYDIRGIADTDLTDETVHLIGRAYGTLMIRRGRNRVSVGRDVRLSSPRIQETLVAGISSTGLDVIRIGQVTTPVTYWSVIRLETDGCVMVTGSHNPIEYNGIKMNDGLLSIHGSEIQDLLKLIQAGDFESGRGEVSDADVLDDYRAMLLERIVLSRPFRIVVDAGNGTAGPVVLPVLEKLGCDVIPLYCEPDGRFPNHLPDPTVEKYVQDLKTRVLAEKADLGLGFDGDSDRVGVVDEKGRLVMADQLLALLARDVLKRNNGAEIWYDVKCSMMLPEEIERLGGRPMMGQTGHALAKKKMHETGAPLAGELSGHIFYKDGFFGFDDGIYVALRFLRFLAGQKQPVSGLVNSLPHYPASPEIRITCPDDDKFEVVASLTRDFQKSYPVSTVDGARVDFGDGWGLIRVSNTQPILVLRFEARTETRLQEIRDIFREKLSAFPAVHVDEMDEATH